MSTATIDTLKFTKRLTAAGMAQGQAEALAEAVAEGTAEGLATKYDLAALETRLEAKLAEVKAELIKWNVGTIIAMTAVFAAIVKLL